MPDHGPLQRSPGTHMAEIRRLTSMTGFPESEVRSVFETEFSRLSSGATVDRYLAVRTMSNALAILRGRYLARHGRSLPR
jgi:hypothetical protein